MRRLILTITILLAMAGCAVAQIPARFVPTDRTGNGTEEVDGMLVGGASVLTTAVSGTFVTTATAQDISGQKTFTTTQGLSAISLGDQPTKLHRIYQNAPGSIAWRLPAINTAFTITDPGDTLSIVLFGWTAGGPYSLLAGDFKKYDSTGTSLDIDIDDTVADFDIPIEADIVEWGPGHSSHAWFDPFLFWGRNTTGSGSPISIGVMLENTGTLTGIDYTMPFLAQRLTAGFKHVQPIIALQDRPNSPRVIAIGWDTTYEAHANKATMVEMSPDTIYGGALYDDAYLIRYPWRPLNDFFWRFDGLLSTPGTVRCTSVTQVHSTTDLYIDGPMSIRDSTGTTVTRIGSPMVMWQNLEFAQAGGQNPRVRWNATSEEFEVISGYWASGNKRLFDLSADTGHDDDDYFVWRDNEHFIRMGASGPTSPDIAWTNFYVKEFLYGPVGSDEYLQFSVANEIQVRINDALVWRFANSDIFCSRDLTIDSWHGLTVEGYSSFYDAEFLDEAYFEQAAYFYNGIFSDGSNDLTLQPASGQALRLRDGAGVDQFVIASIPDAPNGLTSQGETVLTSVTLASVGGGMTTDTAQDITGSKAFKSRQDFDATAGSHDMVNVFSSGTYSGVALRVQSIATTNTQPLAQFNNNAPAPSVQGQTSWNSVNAIGVYGFAGHAAATGVKAHNNAGGLALDVDGDADIDGDVDHQGDYNLDGNIVINGDIECLDLTVDNEITAAVGSVLTIRGAASQRIDMYDGGSNLAMRVWPTNTTVDFEQGVQGIANAAGLAVGVRGYDNATANQTAMNARQRATSGNGMALAVEQTGVTLTGNMTGTLGDFYRTYTLAGNDITGAMVRIWDNAQVDGVSSADLLMVKVTSASNTGKSHIKMESTSAAQTGADYIIDTLGPGAAHPFSLDWDGNLASDGEADYDSYVTAGGPSDHPEGVNVSAITTPAAPTSGVTFFANSSDTPSVIASDGTTSALISQFVGRKAEGELSTVSTSYTTAVTLTFDINSLSGHRMMFFCEVAGEDTSTSCDVRIIVDDTKVVSARNFSFGETYSNNGWQSFCGFNWDPATIGSHTVKVQYKTRNGSKTVYLRRIRVTCERCY